MSTEQQSENNNQGGSLMDYIKFWETKEFKEQKEFFDESIVKPTKTAYAELPRQITEFKQENIFSNFDQNSRSIALGFTTILVAALTKKTGGGLLKVVRNAGITYVGLGAVIVPEVFNPYVHAPNIIDCQECNQTPKPQQSE